MDHLSYSSLTFPPTPHYKNFKQLTLIIILTFILISGCAPAFRANPFLNEKISHVKTIAIMPMDIEVYKVSAGGVRELVDEYSEEAKNNIKYALNQILYNSERYQIKYLPKPEDIDDLTTKQLMKNTIALFKVVDVSVISHTYKNYYLMYPMQGIFPDKLKNFDYTLGPQIKPLREYSEADLLLFMRGGDYLSSGGRIALLVWATVLGFTPTSAGPPHLSGALVDPETGDILWYNYLCPQSGYNFRNQKSVENFVNILLRDLPSR